MKTARRLIRSPFTLLFCAGFVTYSLCLRRALYADHANDQEDRSIQTSYSMLPIDASKTTASFHPRLVFFKFHKVGGTTVAETLILKVYGEKHSCCDPKNPQCQLCPFHDSILIELLPLLVSQASKDLREGPNDARKRAAEVIGWSHKDDATPGITATLLRHPLDRVLSWFYFATWNDAHHTPIDPILGESLLEFARRMEANKTAIAMLNEYSMYMGEDVLKAQRTLDYMDVVGTTENFDGFMVLLAQAIHVNASALHYRKLKKMMGRPSIQDEDPEALGILRKILRPDYEIYNHAQLLYNKQVQESQHWFNSSLAAFQNKQAQAKNRCQEVNHQTKLLAGLDCYRPRKQQQRSP